MDLTVGPNQFFWPQPQRVALYELLAQAPVERVLLGETVCSKREPFVADDRICNHPRAFGSSKSARAARPRSRPPTSCGGIGVECQRDGSDQGQRMEAGDGALTPDRSPAPTQDAHRSPALQLRGSPAISVV